jgi:uracil-DNA glycosylase family 4
MNLQSAAFLAEMGIGPLWVLRVPAPAAGPDQMASDEPAMAEPVSTDLAPDAQAPEALVLPSPPVSEAAAVSAAAIARMDWLDLSQAVASCTRCDLCHSRKHAVPGRGAGNARWIVVGSGPGSADEDAGMAVSGAPGQLLDNMLQAIGLVPQQQVYVTNLVKCRPRDGLPTVQQIAVCRPYLERELALTQAPLVLAIGAPAARGLLGADVSADALRGSVFELPADMHRSGKSAVVATLHPEDLLLQGQDKAQAWADLCLARSAQVARDALQ